MENKESKTDNNKKKEEEQQQQRAHNTLIQCDAPFMILFIQRIVCVDVLITQGKESMKVLEESNGIRSEKEETGAAADHDGLNK